MPDFDVAVIELVEPSSPTPLGILRPAVLVRNSGTNDATVTGTMSAYELVNGTRLWTSALQAKLVPAGQDRTLYAAQPWTPPDVGAYGFTADISTARDEDESDNHLAPVTVTITAAAAPPTAEHGNEAHDPDMLTEPELINHAAAQVSVHGYDVHGDLGIGGAADDLAILDLKSTVKAFIPPRMTTLQKSGIIPAVAGMIVFDTDLAKLAVYTGAAWETIPSA